MKCHNFRVFRHQIAIGFLFIDIIVSFCIVFVYFDLNLKKLIQFENEFEICKANRKIKTELS